MEQIKEEISKSGEITSIIVDDIHGFGNNSIVATTRTIDKPTITLSSEYVAKLSLPHTGYVPIN